MNIDTLLEQIVSKTSKELRAEWEALAAAEVLAWEAYNAALKKERQVSRREGYARWGARS